MVQQLRQGIVDRRPEVTLSGEVECDEVYVVAGHKGHPEAVEKKAGPRRRRRLKGEPGPGTLEKEKPPVFGMIQRTGEVVIRMLADVKQTTIGPLIKGTIAAGTWSTPTSTTSTAGSRSGATPTTRSAMRRASTPGTTTATGSARSTSTRWKGSGRCCGVGFARTGDLAGEPAAVPGLLRVRPRPRTRRRCRATFFKVEGLEFRIGNRAERKTFPPYRRTATTRKPMWS